MNPPILNTLFTAESISKGGRTGTVRSPDGMLNVTMGNPVEPGAGHRGPSPELLFAGAYSACYHSALLKVAARPDTPALDSTVRAMVSLIGDSQGGSHLAVTLHAQLPGVDPAEAQRLMEAAHKICPYSKALQSGIIVKLVVDGPAAAAEKL